MIKKIFLFIFIVFAGSLFSFNHDYFFDLISAGKNRAITYADDDEDEKEEDDDDDDEKKSSPQVEYVYETVTIPATTSPAIVLKEGYTKDTDGDKLVDALDPNPTIPEYALYTDSDNDGIPNAYDKYPNENDFAYVDFVDANKNGISDDLENLLSK